MGVKGELRRRCKGSLPNKSDRGDRELALEKATGELYFDWRKRARTHPNRLVFSARSPRLTRMASEDDMYFSTLMSPCFTP
jgi:hypothetical protein